jgi:hypothetical protein
MTDILPLWLPALLDINGSWNEIRDQLYAVFCADFLRDRPRYEGLVLEFDRRKLHGDGHEEAFWHLVTSTDQQTGDRLLDAPRARRLRWCRATIDHNKPPDVLVFDYEEGTGRIRRYLWVHKCDYLVVLELRSGAGPQRKCFLVTAFYLDGHSSKRRIQQKYDRRMT